jgi:hypothetical protein
MTSAQQNSIAIAIDKEGNVWKGFFCRAPYYALYNSAGIRLGMRPNPYMDNPHKPMDQPMLLIHLLPECTVFIGQQVPFSEHIAEFNIMVIETRESKPENALRAFLAFSAS